MEITITEDHRREVLELIVRNARPGPHGPEEDMVIDAKVFDQVVKATKDKSALELSIQSKIIFELHRILAEMGGDSGIMSITGSYRDTLPDAEILDMLKEYHPDLDFLLKQVTKLAKGE